MSIRLTRGLRAALEAETAATGKSISQLAGDIFIAGLDRRRVSRNDPTQAITNTIAELAELVCTRAVRPSEAAWRDGPSLFKALRIAVSQFVAKSGAPGDMAGRMGADAARHVCGVGSLASPKSRAVHAVAAYWHNLHSAAREVTDAKYALNLNELTNSEDDPVYRALDVANRNRQYDFLKSIIIAALDARRPLLSENIIKALNYHAIACLHASAGEYRQCEVKVRGGFSPPESYRVPDLMDGLIDAVHKNWEQSDPVALATFVLWRLGSIHPFINGNGRTARAASYFVLCTKAGGWISGDPILPELLIRHYAEYMKSLKRADASFHTEGSPNLKPLHALVTRLLNEQLRSSP